MLSRILAAIVLTAAAFGARIEPARIDRIVTGVQKSFQVPGVAVAIVEGNEVRYAKGFGVRKQGDSAAVTTSTRFAIGSTTKAFTTAAMAILVDDKKMSWDDPVRKHLATFRLSDPLADQYVTLRDIVSHRTGLSRNDLLWYGSPWGRDEILRRISTVPLTKPFRQEYQYQNIMFLAAGQAVGRASGGTWEQFVRARILNPLGMANTDFSTKEVVKAPDFASPHVSREGKVEEVPWRNIDNIGPAGSINSSADDLSRWVRMQLGKGKFEGKQVVSEKSLSETHTPQMVIRLDDPDAREVSMGTNMASYGLGWRIQDYRGHHLVSHGGAIDGFRAQVALLPNDNLGIVILMNLGDNNVPECLRSALADEVLGLEAQDWVKRYAAQASRIRERQANARAQQNVDRRENTRPSRELAAYAGEYRNGAYGALKVEVNGAGLRVVWNDWRVDTEHYHFDTFRTVKGVARSFENALISFRLDAKGDPVAVRFADQDFRK